MEVTNVLEAISTYGLWKVIIGFLVFGVATGIGLWYKEAVSEIVKKMFKKRKSKKADSAMMTCERLRKHSFFTKCRMLYKNKIYSIHIKHNGQKSPGRKKMFVDMLEVKLRLRHDALTNFYTCTNAASCARINSSTVDEEKALIDVLWKTIDDYESLWRKAGIPEIVIKKFRKWHSKKVEIFGEAIVQIFEHNDYDTNYEKHCTVLTLLEALLTMTILDAQSTIGDLNGEISGLKYDGYVLE